MSAGFHRGHTADVHALLHCLVDAVGHEWHVHVANAGVFDGAHDGVDECRRTTDRRALADALGADRVVRSGGDDLVQLKARRLPRSRKQIIDVVRSDAVSFFVEGDVLHVGHGVRLG